MSRSRTNDPTTRRALKPTPKASKTNTGSNRLQRGPSRPWTYDNGDEKRLRDLAPDVKASPKAKQTPAGKGAEKVADGKGSSSKTNFAFSAEYRIPARIIKY